MSPCRYDAVIVGAGPAGSSAATVLAAAGLRVALVDKAHFPRDKLCGGLLSERCIGAIRDSFGPQCGAPVEVTTYGAVIFDRDRPLVRVGHYKPMHFTSRRTFDAHLVSVAAMRGAEILARELVEAELVVGGHFPEEMRIDGRDHLLRLHHRFGGRG